MAVSVVKEAKHPTLKIIGKAIPRVDVLPKVTGQAKYADDLIFPNMLYGKVLHAGIPHAKILSIDTSSAYMVDGVVAVVTGKDIPGAKTVGFLGDQQVIAVERVKYVGDVVAVVAAETKDAAKRAVKKIKEISSGEEIATALSNLRDESMAAATKHSTAFSEMGRIANSYKHIKELTREDKELLIEKVLDWKQRLSN